MLLLKEPGKHSFLVRYASLEGELLNILVQVAHFEYEPVGLRTLIVPPFEIEHRPDIKALLINKELEKISRNAQAVHNEG